MGGSVICDIGRSKSKLRNRKNKNFQISESWNDVSESWNDVSESWNDVSESWNDVSESWNDVSSFN